MDLIEMIWNLPQEDQGNHHEHRLAPSTASLESAHESVQDLRLRVVRLTTTCQVLCELLAEKLDIDQESLMQRIQERLNVDPIKKPGSCPTCGQQFHPSKNSCNYCGFIPHS